VLWKTVNHSCPNSGRMHQKSLCRISHAHRLCKILGYIYKTWRLYRSFLQKYWSADQQFYIKYQLIPSCMTRTLVKRNHAEQKTLLNKEIQRRKHGSSAHHCTHVCFFFSFSLVLCKSESKRSEQSSQQKVNSWSVTVMSFVSKVTKPRTSTVLTVLQ